MLWQVANWADDSFGEFRRLQREMNRLFEGAGLGAETFPAVNIHTGNDQVVVNAEIPGMKAEDINISVEADLLTLEGEKKAEDIGGDAVCHRKERGFGKFVRSFKLPYDVNPDNVKATYQNGVLNVVLPRSEGNKPKKIAVAAA